MLNDPNLKKGSIADFVNNITNLCEFTTRTHKFMKLFWTKRLVLNAGFKDF